MRISVAVLTLLFASLLVIAGCGGEKGSVPTETGPTTTAPAETTPATTASTTESGTPQAAVTIINSAGEGVPVRVEIADTPAKRQRGLMERTALAEDAGMLFVYGREVTNAFYMKDTLIPLSIAFIDPQGRIVDIQDMQPLDETDHYPAAPYQYALEVNQGFFAEHGIQVGNMLQ
jgi:uncharacterized membrane protein (UPF0127 family)